jgi:hypothetical protein
MSTIEREKFTFAEKKQEIAESQEWRCYVCGDHLYSDGKAPFIAHKISKGKTNRQKYGSWVIDHRLNMAAVCSGPCNDAVNIGSSEGPIRELIQSMKDSY